MRDPTDVQGIQADEIQRLQKELRQVRLEAQDLRIHLRDRDAHIRNLEAQLRPHLVAHDEGVQEKLA